MILGCTGCIISIHALTRRATFEREKRKCTLIFQSTPSRGGRHGSLSQSSKSRIFQSTPSRGGRQVQFPSPRRVGAISIHALTRRATGNPECAGKTCAISIHALTRRATSAIPIPTAGRRDFNPRPHEEGDRKSRMCRQNMRDFNPRPHEEGDKCNSHPHGGSARFQSTPSRGGRP